MGVYVCVRCDRYANSDEGCITDGDSLRLVCPECECVDCCAAAALPDEEVCAACLAKRAEADIDGAVVREEIRQEYPRR